MRVGKSGRIRGGKIVVSFGLTLLIDFIGYLQIVITLILIPTTMRVEVHYIIKYFCIIYICKYKVYRVVNSTKNTTTLKLLLCSR